MSEMRPRITGTEMEWAVLTRNGPTEIFHQAEAGEVGMAISHKDKRLKRADPNGMLSNGGRYYSDVGQHPEYATAEDTSFMGTVVREFAGEKLVYDSFENAQHAGAFHDFILSKRVVDDKLNTWGYHMSLNADASRVPITVASLAPLGVHLATMNIYTGAGAVIPTTQGGAMFTTAQKVLNLNTDYSGSSHSTEQPLISLRKEALASENLYSRVHVTSLDANMSPWASWMKLGTTSIVLRMMEHNYLGHSKYFRNDMHKVALQVAHDTSIKRPVELTDGSTILPIDIQNELVLHAEKLAKNEGVSAEEKLVLAEWKRVLTDLAAEPERTADRVEWIAKRRFLRRYMARHALQLSDQPVLRLDRRWSHIGPDSIGMKMREKSWAEWVPSAEEIAAAYFDPPTTTRALGRASLIQEYAESRDHNFSVSWTEAQVAGTGVKWSMMDPYNVGHDEYPNMEAHKAAFIGPEMANVDYEPEETDYQY